MNKKFWIPTLQLVVSGLILSGSGAGWKLITEEIKFHREVRADIAEIKLKLGITPKESETHVATRN